MVVMINFHTPRFTSNFVQASHAYRHLVKDVLTAYKPKQSTSPAQVMDEKNRLDEEYLNDIATLSPDFTAYMFAVKFHADQWFEQLQENPNRMLSFEDKFHNLNTQFGMDLIPSHDGVKSSILRCATNYCSNVILLASKH